MDSGPTKLALVAKNRRLIFGIRTNLLIAFSGMAAMTLAASAVAWYGFTKIESSVNHIAAESLPAVTLSLKLSEKSKEAFAIAPALVASSNQQERTETRVILEALKEEIDSLMTSLEASDADRSRIDNLKSIQSELTSNLAELNMAVQQILELQSTRETVIAELAEAREFYIETLQPLIDQAAADVIAVERSPVDDPSADSQVAEAISQLQLLSLIHAEANLAAGLITEAAGVAKEAILEELRERFADSAAKIRESINNVRIEDDRADLSEGATWLLDAGDGVENVFDLRTAELRQIAIATMALRDHRTFATRIGDEVSALVATAEESSNTAAVDSSLVTSRSEVQLAIITALSVLVALMTLLLFVLPRVIRPIMDITDAMSGLAEGDVTIDIPARDRNDEIGRMAQALKVFRDTAIAVQESNMREIQEMRRRLSEAIESISQGFALYDSDDRLVMCNSTYSKMLYPGIEDVLKPGTRFEKICRTAAERGIVLDAIGRIDEWVEERLARHRNPVESHIQHQADDRWILINERITDDESIVAVYADVTELKQREDELSKKSNALEQLSNQLAKYLAPQVYDSIFSGAQEVKVTSNRKKLTVFFSDIEGFTETADRLESEELTRLLNQYLTEMSQIALEHGATIDKYIGDAILIFFGDPESKGVKEDALACVNMAIAMRDKLSSLRDLWRESGIEKPLNCRMGIHTGFCTVGNFGSEDRMDYTIIGGAVNTASRLESFATPGEILISFETFSQVKDSILCEERGKTEVKGIAYPVSTYKVIDTYEKIDRERGHFCEEHYNMSLELNIDAMTSDDRTQAESMLRRGLDMLKRSNPQK